MNVQFPLLLKEERQRLGMGQEEFASLGKVSKRAYIYYEKGERSPDSDFLSALAAAGVDVVYLLTGQRNTLASSVREDPPEYVAGGMTREERAVLDNYRHLSEDDKRLIRRQVDVFAEYYRLKREAV